MVKDMKSTEDGYDDEAIPDILHKLVLDSKVVQVNTFENESSKYAFQVKIERPDGKRFWLSAVKMKLPDGSIEARLILLDAVG